MKKTFFIILFQACAFLSFCTENETPKGRGEHTRDDIQGMWYVDFNMKWPENYGETHSHYYIFKGDKMLTFDAEDPNDFHIYDYGFSNSWIIREIDSLMNKGEYFVYKDERGHIYSSMNTYLVPKEELTIFYDECYYCDDIARYAYTLKILFDKSIQDCVNYGKIFLDCEIATPKDSCSLYDENKSVILKKVDPRRAVVVVQDFGEWVKVRYCAPYEWNTTTGYIRRENLQFVVDLEKIQ